MLFLRFNSHQSDDNSQELKKLKKDFKKIMKKNIYLYEKNEYFKIGNLIKCNNGDKFFKEINKILNKDSLRSTFQLILVLNTSMKFLIDPFV
jgi:hypothetical protein